MREFTLAVVGIDYPNTDRARTNRRSELLLLDPGAPVELRPEPGNRHDARAIAVFSPNGVQVGYLTAERAPFIGGLIRSGEQVVAIYQGVFEKAGYIRVRIGGGAPTLPPVVFAPDRFDQVDPDGGDGFWPDPEGPEWGA